MAAIFVDGDDLTLRSDRRQIAELAVDADSPLDDVAIATDPIVLMALEDAEGEVIANLQAGGRYTVAQLSELTGSALAFLKRMICEIAMLHLFRRRPSWNPELMTAYEGIAKRYLERLANGDAVFGGQDDRLAASRISVDGPTLTEMSRQNTMVARSGYFRKPVLPDGRNI